MPFITTEERRKLDIDKLPPETAGQRCYVFYKRFVDKWKREPKWATANKLFHGLMNDTGEDFIEEVDMSAALLAWQVFFSLHVMPYELQKREENGDI